MAVEIKVPALGESVTEATVAKWLVKAGDAVAIDQPLCELETDKVTVEVNASVAGTIVELAVAEGATIQVGGVLCHIEAGAAAAKPAAVDAESVPAPVDTVEALERLLAAPDLCSKRWVWEQYDYTVMADSVQRPGGDAAVVRQGPSRRAVPAIGERAPAGVAADPGLRTERSIGPGGTPLFQQVSAASGFVTGEDRRAVRDAEGDLPNV